MRLLFIGTGDIGLPTLEALMADPEHEVVGVLTQPDKPAGRKMVMTAPKTKERAVAAGILVLQPRRIRLAVEELAAFHADVFVVVAYGQILPRSILDMPKKGCLNIHASLLPRHRGAAPIQVAIREGDTESGITIMWVDEGLDTGDILLMEALPILPTDTGGSLHDRLAALAPSCLSRALRLIAEGRAPRIPQDPTLATITGKLEREHGRIFWNRSALEIERMIRAYNPWPGTFCALPMPVGKEAHLKVFASKVLPGITSRGIPGTVDLEAGQFQVSCGEGVLVLLDVQMEGRKRMPAEDFLHGNLVQDGTVLR